MNGFLLVLVNLIPSNKLQVMVVVLVVEAQLVPS
jgi:hypothetical protein